MSQILDTDPGGYWVLPNELLKELLIRASDGEDVDLLMMEAYANSTSDQVE